MGEKKVRKRKGKYLRKVVLFCLFTFTYVFFFFFGKVKWKERKHKEKREEKL